MGASLLERVTNVVAIYPDVGVNGMPTEGGGKRRASFFSEIDSRRLFPTGQQSDRLHCRLPDDPVIVSEDPLGGTIMPTTTDRVTKTPGICGGDACIRGHRIPVWGLVNSRRLGADDADILRAYPVLTAIDLEAAWEYAAAHPQEIDRAIHENEEGEEGFVE
jgi:uncharacterized protein (DUF433 family)